MVSHQKGRGFGGFYDPNTDKSIQNGPNLDQKWLSKVLFAVRKCWQRAFLVTKMHFAPSHKNALFPCGLFLVVLGGRRLSSVGLWRLLAFVHCRLTETAAVLCCSSHFPCLPDYAIGHCNDCRVHRDGRKHPCR